jgi:hypothetical protein
MLNYEEGAWSPTALPGATWRVDIRRQRVRKQLERGLARLTLIDDVPVSERDGQRADAAG